MVRTDPCASYKLTRRQVVQAGAATFLGMNLRHLVAHAGKDSRAAAEHVILLWMGGGMTHIDTWDPKPGRPTGGDFSPIETSVPGIQISEILPNIAKEMKHAAIVRSIAGTQGAHEQATYNVLTSYTTTPQLVHPTMGAVAAHELASISELPSFIAINGRAMSAGYLGQKCEAYYVGQAGDPDPYLRLPDGISQVRANRRLDTLMRFNQQYGAVRTGSRLDETTDSYRAAVNFMKSPALKAFELEHEDPAVRQAYGDTGFGRGCLLARRLVEQGVRFVQVSLGGFDTHSNNFPAISSRADTIDPAIAALVRDLATSGMLERTIVVQLSEFGRTPKINDTSGRDHWPQVFSSFMAGGGLKRGVVVGSSDIDGAQPKDRPVPVGDLHATFCKLLGIDPHKEVMTPLRRPMKLVEKGEPVAELMA